MKICALLGMISFWSALCGDDIKVRVLDDMDAPVSGARAKIVFAMIRSDLDIEHAGFTDEAGTFSASGTSQDSVFVEMTKNGHYSARMRHLPKGKDLDFVVRLPRILSPVALYAKNTIAKFPLQNEWLGFDFEVGDWVAPNGKGKAADIQFKFKNEFLGWKLSEEKMARSRQIDGNLSEAEFRNFYGKWDAELEISFPGDKEGLHEETHFLEYSQLKLPHTAPEDGYVPTWRYTANTYAPRTNRENVGFFLRTRVKLDKGGNIVSANYAKVMREFRLDARGQVGFSYYWNPIANDRNLEWDPNRNLLQGLNNEQTPRDP